MKCQTVTKLLVALALLAPCSAALAEISRTQVGSYDLSNDTRVIYNVNLTPTPEGGTIILTRPEDGTTQLSAFVTSCRVGKNSDGKAVVKMRKSQPATLDHELAPLLNYASTNNLRVSMKSLSATRQILLFEDSDTLMIDDKNIPHSNVEKCQQD